MKKAVYLGMLLVVLVGCSGIQTSDSLGEGRLTPYIIQTDISMPSEIPTVGTEKTSTPAPTAIPIIHIVALGETISSIALRYGVLMDALMEANPGVEPTALIVGDKLVIPAYNNSQAAEVDPAILKNIQILVPECIQTRDGGLWCAGLIENQGQEDLEDIVVKFSFRDVDGNVIEEKSAPTIMRHILPGMAVPVVVFLEKVPALYADITMNIFSALVVEASISPYLVVSIDEETRDLNGIEATISGRMRVEGNQEKGQADIRIGAAGFDEDGHLVGVRRLDSSATLNEAFNYSITVYSSAGNIAEVSLYTEAY